jgi:hypothetical protein
VPRTAELTEAIQESLTLGDMWSNYGIVGDVEVCSKVCSLFGAQIALSVAIHC